MQFVDLKAAPFIKDFTQAVASTLKPSSLRATTALLYNRSAQTVVGVRVEVVELIILPVLLVDVHQELNNGKSNVEVLFAPSFASA